MDMDGDDHLSDTDCNTDIAIYYDGADISKCRSIKTVI